MKSTTFKITTFVLLVTAVFAFFELSHAIPGTGNFNKSDEDWDDDHHADHGEDDHVSDDREGWGGDSNSNSGWNNNYPPPNSGWTGQPPLCDQSNPSNINKPCTAVCGAVNKFFVNGCCFGSGDCYCCNQECDKITNRDCDCSEMWGLTQTAVGGACGLKEL